MLQTSADHRSFSFKLSLGEKEQSRKSLNDQAKDGPRFGPEIIWFQILLGAPSEASLSCVCVSLHASHSEQHPQPASIAMRSVAQECSVSTDNF